jgi:hypothetical protein
MTHAAPLPERIGASPFAGHLVHELMGLDLDPEAKHPRFDDDIWDLTGILGAPIQLSDPNGLFGTSQPSRTFTGR